MSASMLRRRSLIGFLCKESVIGGSCLEVGVLDPSILKTERSPRYSMHLFWLARTAALAPTPREAHSRESGFVP
jgi:hypothetical protein